MRPTEQQKRWLKKQVHHLKPVVSLGQAGLTAAVLAEIELALDHHELIKVKIAAGDRGLRDEFIAAIASRTQADLIDRIGNTAAFFRANPRNKAPMDLAAAT
jgi:RNA-binding protein